jgi:hypothetical protein
MDYDIYDNMTYMDYGIYDIYGNRTYMDYGI